MKGLFFCSECNRSKSQFGRRLRFLQKLRLRVYVCAECNEKLLKARAA